MKRLRPPAIRLVHEHIHSRCSDCLVKCNSVLENCTGKCLEEISERKKIAAFTKGSTIFSPEINSRRICFIKKGIIKIVKTGKEGSELIIRFAGPGDIIGLAMPTVEREISATAIEDTVLCYIDQAQFYGLIGCNPDLAFQLLPFYLRELQDAETKCLKLAQLGVQGKVADTLLHIFETIGCNKESHALNILLSRQEIADFAGTTKEQVSRVLSEFRDKEWVRTKGKRIEILNPDALRLLSRI